MYLIYFLSLIFIFIFIFIIIIIIEQPSAFRQPSRLWPTGPKQGCVKLVGVKGWFDDDEDEDEADDDWEGEEEDNDNDHRDEDDVMM